MTPLRWLCTASIAGCVFAASTAHAEMRKEWIEYSHAGTKLKGYLAYDDSIKGKRSAVVLIHRRNGMDSGTLANTEMYAKLGYAVFAADIFGYGQGILPKDVPEMVKHIGIYYKDRPLMRARGQAALEALLKLPMVDASQVATLGYCFGGTVGIEMAYAGAPLAATVTIHGTFRDHPSEQAKNIKGKVMLLHGAEDKVSPLVEVNKIIEDLRRAKVGFQYELYSGTDHGFSTPQNKDEERANVQSIASTTRFLREVFGR